VISSSSVADTPLTPPTSPASPTPPTPAAPNIPSSPLSKSINEGKEEDGGERKSSQSSHLGFESDVMLLIAGVVVKYACGPGHADSAGAGTGAGGGFGNRQKEWRFDFCC